MRTCFVVIRWPVFSWSSLEFGGGWKALHHAAKRFFAPALVCAHVPGDESFTISNKLKSTIHEARLFTVYDGRETRKATLGWSLIHLEKGVLRRGSKAVVLRHGQSRLQHSLDLGAEMRRWGAGTMVLRLVLTAGGRTLSENTVLLTAPRFMTLPEAPVQRSVRRAGPGQFELTLRSAVFQSQVQFALEGHEQRESDNYFDLYPGEPRLISVRVKRDLSVSEFKKSLKIRTLASV